MLFLGMAAGVGVDWRKKLPGLGSDRSCSALAGDGLKSELGVCVLDYLKALEELKRCFKGERLTRRGQRRVRDGDGEVIGVGIAVKAKVEWVLCERRLEMETGFFWVGDLEDGLKGGA